MIAARPPGRPKALIPQPKALQLACSRVTPSTLENRRGGALLSGRYPVRCPQPHALTDNFPPLPEACSISKNVVHDIGTYEKTTRKIPCLPRRLRYPSKSTRVCSNP